MIKYAGIGSRSTPSSILDEMRKIARSLSDLGLLLHSGHADGADWAFEQGAGRQSIAFLPWEGFNKNLPILGQSIVIKKSELMDSFVYKYHPAPQNLSMGAFALMRRNTAQVLGASANEPVSFIVCWTPGGAMKGGTSQALRIAQDYKIPVVNMFSYPTHDLVIARLDELDIKV